MNLLGETYQFLILALMFITGLFIVYVVYQAMTAPTNEVKPDQAVQDKSNDH